MASFYRGFAYERLEDSPLTIEGRPIPGGRGVKEDNLRAFVRRYVTESGALQERTCRGKQDLAILAKSKDAKAWNDRRLANPNWYPMLAGVDVKAKVKNKSFDKYDFSYANLTQSNLSGLSFVGANFHQAILAKANLSGANVEGANFCRTDLYETDFRQAHFTGANLQGVQFARTDLRGADLSQCKVYGLSAWDLILDKKTKQGQLRVAYRPMDRPRGAGAGGDAVAIVDSVDLAAFIYMTAHNPNISRIFAETGRKWVLLLGRFGKNMAVLDRLRQELTSRQYIPIVFDFSRPKNTDLIETVVLLAGMSAFVIVDLTDPRSTPMELQAIAPTFGVPIVPIIRSKKRAFGTFSSLRKLFWVLPPVRYHNVDHLVRDCLDQRIIKPACSLADTLARVKSGQRAVRVTGTRSPGTGRVS